MTPPVSTTTKPRVVTSKERPLRRWDISVPSVLQDAPSTPKRSNTHISHPFLDIGFVLLVGFALSTLGEAVQRLSHAVGDLTVRLPLMGYRFPGLLLVYSTLVVLCCQSQGLYQSEKALKVHAEVTAVFKAVLYATLITIAFVYLSNWQEIPRSLVLVVAGLSLMVTIGWRLGKRIVQDHRFAHGTGTRNVLIIGAGKIGRDLEDYISANKELGLEVKGFLDHFDRENPKVLGSIDDLMDVAREHFIDEVFISIPSERELVRQIALEARRNRLNVKVIPELFDGLGYKAPVSYLGDFPVMDVHSEPIATLGLLVKRIIDIIGSFFALLLLAPLMLLIAGIIKINSPGPAVYASLRVGKKGRKFPCYKFRTMVMNAEDLKSDLLHMNERSGPFFKIANDPRVTRLGKILRNLSLDEIPQFWNVLTGDMSLVGPRPHPIDDFEKYTLRDLKRLDVTPGITGLWQVTARRDPSFEKNLALDIQYIENWSIWLDLEIILRTIPALVKGQ